MKLLHLSDLHLGKRLGDLSLLEDQSYILTQILNVVDECRPQAVLIAGDVYDRSTPSVEAVRLFDDFLVSLAQRGLQVYVIGGNHDSMQRLSFGARLMGQSGVHIAGNYEGEVLSFTQTDAFGSVCFYLLPFVRPAQVCHFCDEETAQKITDYTDALRHIIRGIPLDPTVRNVLIAHQFVTGAQCGGSEELIIGGLDNVDASVFEPFDYVALGHIHGRQNIGSPRVHYCGTPLKYSFAEAAHKKTVTLVELEEKGSIRCEEIPLAPLRDMRHLKGRLQELVEPQNYREQERNDYIHATLTDEEEITGALDTLRMIYPNLLKLDYDNRRTRLQRQMELLPRVETRPPLEIFEEFYEQQNGMPMSEEQTAMIENLIAEIWEERE